MGWSGGVAYGCAGGSREILRGGRYGPLVPVGDTGALAAAVEEVLDAPSRREVVMAGVGSLRAERCAREYFAASRGAGGTGA